MGITWDHAADAKLLIAIIKTAKPKIDHKAVAEYMGDECTAYAVQHRIRKIQTIAKGVEGKDSSCPSTPAKPRTPRSTRSTPRSAAVKKRKIDLEAKLEDIDDAESEEERHLSKKRKYEDDDNDEDGDYEYEEHA